MPLLVFTTPSTPRGSRLDSIPAGALRSDIAHLFAYKNSDVFLRRIEMSHLSPTDTTLWEVRLYPDMEDSRDLSDGYDILAAPRLHANNPVYILNEDDYRLPTTSYLTVWAKAASGSVRQVTGSALIEVKIK